MNIDTTRRGVMGLISGLTATLATPAKVAEKAAMTAAQSEIFSGAAAVAGIGGTGRLTTPIGIAERMLERRAWGMHQAGTIRPAIACFKSASLIAKTRWERDALYEDSLNGLICDRALEILRSGKISI